MERLKIAIYEGRIGGFDDEDLDLQVNEFSETHEVVNVDVKQSWLKGYYIATIQYIDKGE